MKNKFTKKHKHVLITKGTQGMALPSLAVVSRLINYRKSSAPCARMLSFFGSLWSAENQPKADSASCARVLSRPWAGLIFNVVRRRASSAPCARMLSLLGVLLVSASLLGAVVINRPSPASAATSNQLNFQGRLLTASGSLVPDGIYNMHFDLYYQPSGGSSQWTEDRLVTNTQGVSVQNGYFSVYLGQYDAFPAIDWSEDLYLGMTVRGTTNCAWGSCSPTDSEMNPRFKLTAVPYAFRASNVASSNTNSASTNSDGVSITTGDALGATSNSGNITIDVGSATGTEGSISLGSVNASALNLGRSGLTTTNVGNLLVQGGAGTFGTTSQAGSLVLHDGSSNTGTIQVAALGSNEVYVLPDSDGNDTICLQDLANCAGAGDIVQNGNSFGAAITIGTNDTYDLNFETNGTTRITVDDTTGNVNFTGSITLAASQTLTVTGGNTASRPGSPTEGMVYFDTDTDRLMTYANGKWQTDSREAILVAASNSSQADKDAADYVANGDGGGAGDGDQVQINSALTAGSGKKVVLLAGTYVADATILVPNNTTLAGVGPGSLIEFGDIDAPDTLIENSDTTTGTGIIIRDLRLNGRGDLNSNLQKGIYLVGMGDSSSDLQGAIIENVTIENFTDNPMMIDDSDLNTIQNVTFVGNLFGGLDIWSTSEDNVVTNNKFIDNPTGVYSEGIRTNITNNQFIGTTYDSISVGFTSGPSNITISNNSIEGGTRGIATGELTDSTITNNTISNTSLYGLYIEDGSQLNIISGNRITNSGGSTANNGIYLLDSDFNSITNNIITDSSCDTTCYAINISNSTSDKNYLEGNRYSDTDADSGDDATINDAGTGTIYAGQSTGATSGTDVSNFLFKGANSTTMFNVQNASGASILNVDTTNSEVEIGNSSTAGKLVISDGSSNTGTILVNATSGDYTFTIPTVTANDTFCLVTLNNCSTAAATLQSAYTADVDGSDAVILLTAADGAVVLRDAASTVGTLLVVEANGGSDYFNVSSTGITLGVSTTLAANQSLTITGGNTASRPGSPTEGMIYFDTTTKQLLTYANGKWQADRTEAVLVAASNSSQADKDAADYVGDGNTGAANDGDQVQINSALTAASGKKVVLLAGTYVADATILVPNNTTLTGVGNGTVIEMANLGGSDDNLIENLDTSTGKEIKIRDFKLEGRKDLNTTGEQTGIYIDSVLDISISGITVQNFTLNGIYVFASSFVAVSNNTVRDNDGIGISVESVSDTLVSENIIQNNDFGVLMEGYNITINDNDILGGSRGIAVQNSDTSTIENNVITDSTSSGIYVLTSDSIRIDGNRIADLGQGNTSINDGIYLEFADFNTIMNNFISDSACDTTCYAINISNADSDKNYLEGNRYSDTDADSGDDATIQDSGTGTIYAGQSTGTTSGTDVSNFLFRGANSTTMFNVQNASGASILNIDTTNGEVEIGNSSTAGKLVISDGSSNTGTILVNATSGDYTFTIPTVTANDTFCLVNLNNCSTAAATLQSAYTADADTGDAVILLTAADGAVVLRDAASTIGTLFVVEANGGTDYFSVTNSMVTANGDLTVSGGEVYITPVSSSASTTEGTVYYDSDTDRLLVYANGKWQADRTDAVLVAASNSSQADKDAADYVADGDNVPGVGTIDGDQVQINSALTAASGKKVVLLAGTYVADATILVPNNTTLAGVGKGTVIQLADIDATDNLIEATGASRTGQVIRDLSLDGQKSAQTGAITQYGIFIDTVGSGSGAGARQGAILENLWISNFETNGINVSDSENNKLVNVVSSDNDNDGIHFDATTSNNHNQIINSRAQGNGESGFYIEGWNDYTISGNIASGNGSRGFFISASLTAVTGNTASSNTEEGFLIAFSTNTTISSNVAYDNGTSGIATYNASHNSISNNNVYNSGDAITNNGIKIATDSDFNSITNNVITDTSCDTNCYAIFIEDPASDKNYLEGNRYSDTDADSGDDATIQDSGTGTIYAGQSTGTTSGTDVSNFLFRGANSTTMFNVQNASGASILNIDTTNGEVEIGNSSTAGRLVISDGSSNTGTILVNATSGNYTFTIPTVTANDTFCLQSLANCGGNTTLQGAYTNDADGSDAVIVLTATDGAVVLRDAASTVGTLFVVEANGGTDYLAVTSTGTTVGGTLGVSGDTNLDGNVTLGNAATDTTTSNGSIVANNSATSTTGTTTGTGTNTTTLALTSDPFSVNDVVFINNTGQDYYTRITVDPGTNSYTVSPAVTFEAGVTVTKYNIQNIGATPTDYTTQTNRFFQGYFLGGVVVGAGSTSLSDGLLKSSGTLNLQANTSTVIQNASNGTETFAVKDATGSNRLVVDTTNNLAGLIASGGGLSAGLGDFNAVSFPPTGWTTGGDANWVRDTVTFWEGAGSATSGTIGDEEQSWIDTNFTAPTDGTLSFDWKVSSESPWDNLMFCIDDDANCTLAGDGEYDAISGNVDWVHVNVPVTAGAHSFRWAYEKDDGVAGGSDEAWIDNVNFISGDTSLTVSDTAGTLIAGDLAVYIDETFGVFNSSGEALLRVDATYGDLVLGNEDLQSAIVLNDGYGAQADLRLESGGAGGTGFFRFGTNGTNGIIAQFRDCCNAIFNVGITGGWSEFGTGLGVGLDFAVNGSSELGDSVANDTLTFSSTIQGTNALVFEGSSADASETTLAITDPTADRTITLPDLNGTIALTSNNQTFSNTQTFSGTLSVTGNTTIGDANTDTIIINAGTSGSGITFSDASFQNCVLSTSAAGVLTCASSGALITLNSAYTGGNTITTTDNRNILFTLADTATDSDFYVNLQGTGNEFAIQDGGSNVLTVVDGGNVTLTADIAINGDDITSDGNLTVDATGYVRIGDTGSPGVANGDDDLFVEGDLEADGVLNVSGAVTFGNDLTFTTDATRTIKVQDQDTAATAGSTLQITGAAGNTSGAGGAITVQAGTGGSSGVGGVLTLQGGSGGGSGQNGGNINILGGLSGGGAGVKGLVVIDTATYSAATVQNFTANANITQANVDSYGSILISGNVAGWIATLPDPTQTTAGRVVYITNSGSVDITLAANSVGVALSITLKPASTATMYWNGTDWTAAGASSSTDLQAAYNNTAASAGNAEIVLSSTGTGGLTIRNDASTPITGGLLEVQTSIGSNLFTVNNNAAEYASNGGAESSTFTAWTAHGSGPSVTRYTTVGNNIATGVGSVFVDTTSTANTGAKNTLSTALTANLRYKVSYTARHTSSTGTFTALETYFSSDGSTASIECGSDATIYYNTWTRVDCTFTPTSTGASNAIFFRHTDGVEHDFYIDNFSVTIDASSNHAVDGAVDSALGSNWQAYDADGGAGTSSASRDTSNIYDTSGSVAVTTTAGSAEGEGVRNNMAITPSVSTQYLVSFYAKSSTSFSDIKVGFLPAGGSSTPLTAQLCADYNTQTVSTSVWTKITCIFTTPSSGISDPDLVIYQGSAAARIFYIDALSITLNTNNSSNVQVGGGQKGGPTTLFTLDRSYGAPIADNNNAYLGSMYYDTSTGRIQCYEADGWGACGAAPDNIVNLNPEYAGAVLNGTGVGTMTADFCSNQSGVLDVNTSLCSTGQAKNFYKWTSPQATMQTYSIYVTYQLPATFNGFSSDDTVQLYGRVDNTSNASVTYEMYKSTGSAVTQCGSSETNVITGGGGSANTWYTYGINGNEATGCSFSSSSAGNFVIFKINMKANSNANAYVSTLSFTTTGR